MHKSDATPRCHPGLEPGSRLSGAALARLPWTPDQVRGDSGGAETVPSVPPPSPTVMPGLVPGIHVLRHRAVSGDKRAGRPTWMPGTSPGMTTGREMRARPARHRPRPRNPLAHAVGDPGPDSQPTDEGGPARQP